MTGRAPYFVAGAAAFAVFLALAAVAPLGHDWVWFDFPRRMTITAFLCGMVGIGVGRLRWTALLIPLVVGAVAWALEMWHAHNVIKQLGWSEIPPGDKDIIFRESFECVAPWLVGATFAALVALADLRTDDHRDRVRAGIVLVALAAIAAYVVLANDNWLTLENLSKPGTYVSSVPWPDTKKLALVTTALAGAGGAALVVTGRR